MGVVVPLDEAREPSQSLAPLLELVDEDMNAINRIILDKAVSDVELIPELTHHLVNSGGKRLRPMLAIASSKLCGYRGQGHVRTAAAIEFIETHSQQEIFDVYFPYLEKEGYADYIEPIEENFPGTLGLDSHPVIADEDIERWVDWLDSRGDIDAGDLDVSDVYTNEFNPNAE